MEKHLGFFLSAVLKDVHFRAFVVEIENPCGDNKNSTFSSYSTFNELHLFNS